MVGSNESSSLDNGRRGWRQTGDKEFPPNQPFNSDVSQMPGKPSLNVQQQKTFWLVSLGCSHFTPSAPANKWADMYKQMCIVQSGMHTAHCAVCTLNAHTSAHSICLNICICNCIYELRINLQLFMHAYATAHSTCRGDINFNISLHPSWILTKDFSIMDNV